MVIWSEFHMGQYRVDDHREDAPHFNLLRLTPTNPSRLDGFLTREVAWPHGCIQEELGIDDGLQYTMTCIWVSYVR